MAFDGIVTKSVKDELEDKLLGGRIDKIYQQEDDEILINIYNKGENYKLLLSASSNNPRFYLTKHSKSNPQNPPMFCMILRKHLTGGIVLNVEQYETDRIIFIDISSRDEMGFDTEKRIVLEVMGRHSNIILVNKKDDKVIDSVIRVYEDMSSFRQIFPGAIYTLPPLQEKANILRVTEEDILKVLKSDLEEDEKLFKFLYGNFLGFSPILSKELCHLASLDKNLMMSTLTEENLNALVKTLLDFKARLIEKKYSPSMNVLNDKVNGFHCIQLTHLDTGENLEFDSMSSLLDQVFVQKDTMDRINQKSQSTKKIVQTKLARTENKLDKQEEELAESKNREIYKIYADLISANLYAIEKGSKSITVDNFYDEDMGKLEIPLDYKISGVQNAQKYYKKYSKLKNAHNLLITQIEDTKEEIAYLENVLLTIDHAKTVEDIDEIKEELILEGYVNKKINPKDKLKISKPYHYVSSDGFDIFVGKNNRQNDLLTFKKSRKDDLWLHVKDMPGSHVIIDLNGQAQASDVALKEAASLAAFYSKARESSNVLVDYTIRKNVKKPNGAKAGMVIYFEQETLAVTPDENMIKNMEEKL